MAIFFGINTASCGKKLLRILERFSETLTMIDLLKASYESFRSYTGSSIGLQALFLFRFLLADFVI